MFWCDESFMGNEKQTQNYLLTYIAGHAELTFHVVHRSFSDSPVVTGPPPVIPSAHKSEAQHVPHAGNHSEMTPSLSAKNVARNQSTKSGFEIGSWYGQAQMSLGAATEHRHRSVSKVFSPTLSTLRDATASAMRVAPPSPTKLGTC